MHTHLIFSTKDRAPLLFDEVRDPLHAYVAGILKEIGCHAVIINSMADHVHVLFNLGRVNGISHVVEAVKTGASKWLKTRDPRLAKFAWQSGYASFAVSESNLESVREYVANQAEHHRERSFQDEYRAFLKRHGIAFDERYVWD